MGWFSKLFSAGPQREPRSLEELVNAYGKALASGASVERDLRELPFSKEAIKAGLLEAIRITPPGAMREQLKAGYVSLGDFQDLQSIRERNGSVPKTILAEAEILLRELKDLGL